MRAAATVAGMWDGDVFRDRYEVCLDNAGCSGRWIVVDRTTGGRLVWSHATRREARRNVEKLYRANRLDAVLWIAQGRLFGEDGP